MLYNVDSGWGTIFGFGISLSYVHHSSDLTFRDEFNPTFLVIFKIYFTFFNERLPNAIDGM